ncbi:sensor histidine kinase [Paenibacillus athensensis]|uniref:histidine kinase n=1 Tax=Paenibacillus athensensis TaxID=1967502 RepID=A0A4Y8PTN6_9BACL|nr:sensor histidine kinase [Paenibacillus athensensis]MCD1261770.1 sensor histidine kinase [Paenibacillus athensensis]
MKLLQGWNSIRNRIFFSILLFLILPFLVSYYWLDRPLERVIEQKIGDASQEALTQVNFDIALFLDDMLRQAVAISTHPEVTELLQHPEHYSDYERLRLQDVVINKQFSSYFTETYVTLLDLNGHWLSNRYMTEDLYSAYVNTSWYREAAEAPFQLQWKLLGEPYVYSDKKPLITLVKSMTDLQTNRNIGVLLFAVAEPDLRKYLTPLDGEVALLDASGQMIAGPSAAGGESGSAGKAYLQEALKQRKGQSIVSDERGKWIVNYDTITETGWKLVQLIPYDTVFHEIFAIRRTNVAIVLGIFLLFMAITLSISWGITKPLKLLNKRMEDIQEREFRSVIAVSGPSEVATLIRTYNEMARQIRELIQRLKEQYQQREDLRFRALQAQIRPHFILNTLNNIKWMAYIRKESDIGDMLSSLGGMLEASIGRGGNLISLEQEMQYIENYIALMKLKYDDKLTLITTLPAELRAQEMLKFTLQPLVENCIQYGIEPLDGAGIIEVEAAVADDCVLLTVRDNGAGISPARLEELERLLESDLHGEWSTRVGLKNVHDRIRLHFGESFGLSLRSEPGAGTEVLVRLPQKLMEKGLKGEASR